MSFTYRKRRFIAPASTGSTAHVLAEVESSHGGTYAHCHGMLVLADCHRRIQLEFYLGSARYRRSSLAKLDALVGTLIDFRNAVRQEAELIEKEAGK